MICRSALSIDAADAGTLGRDPDPAAAVLDRIHDFFLRQPLRLAQRLPDTAAADADPAPRGADHQGPVWRDADGADAVVLQRWRVAAVEDVEFQTVVADQAFPGAEPEIAVGRLRDRIDLVVRQAVAGGPGLAEEGADRLVDDAPRARSAAAETADRHANRRQRWRRSDPGACCNRFMSLPDSPRCRSDRRLRPIQAGQRPHVLPIVGQFRDRIADVAQRGVRGMLAHAGQHRRRPAPGEFLERADVEVAVMEVLLQRAASAGAGSGGPGRSSCRTSARRWPAPIRGGTPACAPRPRPCRRRCRARVATARTCGAGCGSTRPSPAATPADARSPVPGLRQGR